MEHSDRPRLDDSYYRELFANLSDAVVLLSADDRVLEVNRAFERIFGYSGEEACGRLINDLIVPDEHGDQATALSDRVRGGEMVAVETTRARKGGGSVEVRVLGYPLFRDGQQIGIKPLAEALNMARAVDLDLVEVADQANPPVCRIMDYGKYKYEAAQRAKESRRKSSNVSVKEMKYRPKIGIGDFNTKTRKVEGFLLEGNKVKVTIMFRGREMQHPELGRRILDDVADEVAHAGAVEVYPKQDGRNMIMVLGPDKKAQAAWRAEQEAEAEAEAAGAGD